MIKSSSSISSVILFSILSNLLLICDVNGMNTAEFGKQHAHQHASGSINKPNKFGRCSICHHPLKLDDISALKCGHTYHKKCIEKWIKEGHNNCPVCPMKAHTSDIINLFIDEPNESNDEPSNLFGKCSTCFNPFQLDDISALKCGHTYHNECIQKWIYRGNNNCPVCRMETHEIIPIFIEDANNDEFIFKPMYDDVEMENRNTFTLKDYFGIIQSNKPFIISSERKIQYFEVVLLRKGKESKKPFKIVLQGVDANESHATQSYHDEPEAEINESFGYGLFNDNGKIFLFFKEKNKITDRILIDFPLVVTSIAHPWFDRSALASRPENSNFADFYYWRRGIPNSEYISAYKNSMLKYFHVKSRPDLPILAWQNAGNVSDAIKAALSFWIGKGVVGFHFSSIDYLNRSPDGLQPNWEQIAKILKLIRAHVHGEMTKTNNKIFLFTSHEHLSERTKRLLTKDSHAVDAVLHTEMRKLAIGNKICSKEEASIAECANEIVADLLFFHQHSAGNDEKNWPIWSFGSPFCPRLAKRVGSRAVGELLILLELILPGTPLVYFGEEIGREDEIIQQNCNKFKHQNVQIPLIQSNGTKIENFDFSANLVRTFRRMVRLRRHSKTIANGQTYITKPIDQQSFALCRYLRSEEDGENEGIESTNNNIYGEILIYAANFGPIDQTISFADLPPFHLPTNPFKKGKIVARSINALSTFRINSFVDLGQRKIELGPVQAVIIKTSADFY